MLLDLLVRAAEGSWPPADGAVEVIAPPSGRADAVVAFTAHSIVAAGVTEEWVRSHLPPENDLTGPMRADFLSALGARLETRPGSLDVVLAAPALGEHGGSEGGPALLEVQDLDHPRIARARRYRAEVRAYEVPELGVVAIGRGLDGRWEVAVEIAEPRSGSGGSGRTLLRAARGLIAPGEWLFAAVAPGNARALRAALAAGFRPLGGEVLFLRAEA